MRLLTDQRKGCGPRIMLAISQPRMEGSFSFDTSLLTNNASTAPIYPSIKGVKRLPQCPDLRRQQDPGIPISFPFRYSVTSRKQCESGQVNIVFYRKMIIQQVLGNAVCAADGIQPGSRMTIAPNSWIAVCKIRSCVISVSSPVPSDSSFIKKNPEMPLRGHLWKICSAHHEQQTKKSR